MCICPRTQQNEVPILWLKDNLHFIRPQSVLKVPSLNLSLDLLKKVAVIHSQPGRSHPQLSGNRGLRLRSVGKRCGAWWVSDSQGLMKPNEPSAYVRAAILSSFTWLCLEVHSLKIPNGISDYRLVITDSKYALFHACIIIIIVHYSIMCLTSWLLTEISVQPFQNQAPMISWQTLSRVESQSMTVGASPSLPLRLLIQALVSVIKLCSNMLCVREDLWHTHIQQESPVYGLDWTE